MEPTTRPPLEINDEDPNKGVEAARKLLQTEGLEETDENLFIAATCKDKGLAFLKGEAELGVRKIKKEAPKAAAPAKASGEPAEYTVSVNGKDYFMAFEGNHATVNGKIYRVDIRQEGGKSAGDSPTTPPASETIEATPVSAQMPGKVLKVVVSVGQPVQEGDSLLVLEAMKMEVQVSAPVTGSVSAISVSPGDQVNTGQVLASIV